MKYLLPCHGDRVVEVTVANAGHTITCPCGKSVTVPTLRELKRLPLAAPEEKSSLAPQAPAWSLQQGILFSVGLLVLVASCIAAGIMGYKRSQLDTEAIKISEQWHDILDAGMDSMEPATTLEMWDKLVETPLPDRTNVIMRYEVHRKASAQLFNRMMFAGAVGVLGAGLMLAGLFIRPAPKARAKRPKPQLEHG